MKQTGIVISILLLVFTLAGRAYSEPVVEISTDPQLPVPNLVENPGFEQELTSWGLPKKEKFKQGDIIEVGRERVYSGKYSLKVKSAERGRVFGASQHPFYENKLVPGIPYVVSGWVFCEEGLAIVRVTSWSSDWKSSGGQIRDIPTTKGKWGKIEAVGSFKANAKIFSLQTGGYYTKGTYYFDDIFVGLAKTKLSYKVKHPGVKQVRLYDEEDNLIAESEILPKGTNAYSNTREIYTFKGYYLEIEDYEGKIFRKTAVNEEKFYSLEMSPEDKFHLGKVAIANLENRTGEDKRVKIKVEITSPSGKTKAYSKIIDIEKGKAEPIIEEIREAGKYVFDLILSELHSGKVLRKFSGYSFEVPKEKLTLTLNQKYYTYEENAEAKVKLNLPAKELSNGTLTFQLKQGKQVKETKKVKRPPHIVKEKFNISKLPIGDYTVTASLQKNIASSEYTFHKIKGYGRKPKIEIDKESLALLVNGKPFFPIAISHPKNEEGVKAVKGQGFNTVSIHPGIWGKYIDPRKEPDWGVIGTRLEEFINSCHANKLFGMVSLGSSMRHNKWEKMKEFISKYKEHPTVLVWLPMDEPGPELIPDLLKTYNIVKSIDPSHPIAVCLGWKGIMCPAEYKDVCDILVTDPYPITKDSANLLMVADYTDRMVKAVDNKKPVWMWLQAFGEYKNYILPTPAQERCMSYLAIIHGAKGLGYFSYGKMMPKEKPALWNSFKSLTAELTQMAPMILARTPKQNVTVIPEGTGIHYLLKEYKGKKYIFAANPVEKEVKATFKLPGLKRKAKLSVLFEDREVPMLTGNSFTDTFSKYAVHIYEIK